MISALTAAITHPLTGAGAPPIRGSTPKIELSPDTKKLVQEAVARVEVFFKATEGSSTPTISDAQNFYEIVQDQENGLNPEEAQLVHSALQFVVEKVTQLIHPQVLHTAASKSAPALDKGALSCYTETCAKAVVIPIATSMLEKMKGAHSSLTFVALQTKELTDEEMWVAQKGLERMIEAVKASTCSDAFENAAAFSTFVKHIAIQRQIREIKCAKYSTRKA